VLRLWRMENDSAPQIIEADHKLGLVEYSGLNAVRYLGTDSHGRHKSPADYGTLTNALTLKVRIFAAFPSDIPQDVGDVRGVIPHDSLPVQS
jgi:hypothetical protein